MIIYFSGTGNSEYAARKLAHLCSDKAYSIPKLVDGFKFNLDIEEGKPLGIVFPVYAWGPPKIVTDFLAAAEISYRGYNLYTYALATCGDDTGNTMKKIRRILDKKSLTLCSEFSIKMPNNYILSFDVDSKEIECEKLELADSKLEKIADSILKREEGMEDSLKGKFAAVKSSLIYGFFNKFMISDRKFTVSDSCSRCGLCERACPVKNITVNKDGVKWHGKCSGCLGCINICPMKAIQFGKSTVDKGRYYNKRVLELRREDENL